MSTYQSLWLPNDHVEKSLAFSAGGGTFVTCWPSFITPYPTDAIRAQMKPLKKQRQTYRHTMQPRFERVCFARLRPPSAAITIFAHLLCGDERKKMLTMAYRLALEGGPRDWLVLLTSANRSHLPRVRTESIRPSRVTSSPSKVGYHDAGFDTYVLFIVLRDLLSNPRA